MTTMMTMTNQNRGKNDMLRLLPLHIGGVDNGRERLFTAYKGSRSEVLYDLNNWLFDFFYIHKLTIEQLPPLDDWTHSTEDESYWAVAFQADMFQVWVRTELIEYKF